MAQDISLMGAQYSAVPAVVLPKTGGGTARFTDTSGVTATAEDVASGKVFVDASGEEQTGTASGGGGATIEPLSITENGTYTAPSGTAYSPVTVNVAGGGGEWWDTPDPTDGKTHLWIEIPEDQPSNRLTMQVRYTQSVSKGVTVDWGDGTDPQTFTGTSAANRDHTYAQGGHYEITLEVTSGTIIIAGSSTLFVLGANNGANYWKRSVLKRAYLGNGFVVSGGVGAYIFANCSNLEKVHLPNGIKSIVSNAFSGCSKLRELNVPDTLTTIGASVFSGCQALPKIEIPAGVTSILERTFSACYALTEMPIQGSVKSIGQYGLSSLWGMKRIEIPNGVTSLGQYAFYMCERTIEITIPASVTEIGNYCFYNCYSVSEYHFKPTTPPTLGTSAFYGIPSDCRIFVPYSDDHSILEAYKAATNWSAQASKMVEEDAP